MKKLLIMTALTTAIATFGLPASAGALIKFDGGIGVQPLGAIGPGNTVVPNAVQGVAPGGVPWVIERLRGEVRDDGKISVRGEGLIFAGGPNIGTRGPVQQVIATLFCGAQGFSSAPAPLDINGDFEISGQLIGMPPNPCQTPILLIRNAGGAQNWFAAGIPKN